MVRKYENEVLLLWMHDLYLLGIFMFKRYQISYLDRCITLIGCKHEHWKGILSLFEISVAKRNLNNGAVNIQVIWILKLFHAHFRKKAGIGEEPA